MLSTILIGLSIAMVVFLIAAGLSLILGMLGVINFAHGTLYMLGAFVAVTVIGASGDFLVALVVAPLVVGALGLVIETALMRPLYRQPHEKQFLLTFGLLLLIEEVARFFWGADYRGVAPPAFLSGQVVVFGEALPVYRIFVLCFGLALGVALILFIDRSRIGMVLRAAMTNEGMTRGLGIRVSRYRTLVFGLGGALAGVAGVVAAPLLPVQVNMGTSVLIESFIVVIAGGLGNIGGTLIAAILLGQAQAFGQQYAASWVQIVTYVLLAALLLLRPQGLFNSKAVRKA